MSLYIGLMSGTSMDGIDAALVDIGSDSLSVIAYLERRYPERLREALRISAVPDPQVSLRHLMELHISVGREFAAAAQDVMRAAAVTAAQITAIGSHGQTLLHSPDSDPPFTLQIGDPATIAVGTGIVTVSDLRSMDIATGGQGAPLAPAFHAFAFGTDQNDLVVVNIGGIANATFLPGRKDAPITAFDTGPGNCLMDEWIQAVNGSLFDRDGRFAASGAPLPELLANMRAEAYFQREPPKTTGRDLFNTDWLTRFKPERYDPADVQATLAELTVTTIAAAVTASGLRPREVLVCGGGAANPHLLGRLGAVLPHSSVADTGQRGLAPECIEACAFAWLAHNRLKNIAFPSDITGARRPQLLGAIYAPA